MNFFKNFDRVYCINLKHREDRKTNVLNQCEKYNLGEVHFFEAINGKDYDNHYGLLPGAFGLILSNIEILKDAKNNNYKTILIMEDDCYFTDEIKIINTYLDMLPDDWDMLYLGGNHNIGWMGTPPPIKINEKIIKVHTTFTTHFVAIKNHMFEVLLNNMSTFKDPLDVIYTDIQKRYNVYCTSNTIAHQMDGYSDIERKYVNYHHMIKS